MPEDEADSIAFSWSLFLSSLEDAGLEYVVLPCGMKDLAEHVAFEWVAAGKGCAGAAVMCS